MVMKLRNQKEIPTPKSKVGKTKLTPRKRIVRQVGSYFPIIGGHSVTRTYI